MLSSIIDCHVSTTTGVYVWRPHKLIRSKYFRTTLKGMEVNKDERMRGHVITSGYEYLPSHSLEHFSSHQLYKQKDTL